MGEVEAYAEQGASGVGNQVEVDVFWDDPPGGALRVIGTIDDGTFRAAFRPVTDDFLKHPDGRLQGWSGEAPPAGD